VLRYISDPHTLFLTVNGMLFIRVADSDHFDADPDPTSEKTGCGSGSKIRIRSCSKQNFVTRYYCFKMAYKTYLLIEKLE
jgi:hypothetical protein